MSIYPRWVKKRISFMISKSQTNKYFHSRRYKLVMRWLNRQPWLKIPQEHP